MTTMAAKLKGQGAGILRPLTPEIKAIKAAARQRGGDPYAAFMAELYRPVRDIIVSETYSAAELRKLADVCIYEAEKELKEIHRRRKALAKEAAKLAKKEAAHGNGNNR